MQPAVVYAEELDRLGYGRPMWMPERPEVSVELGDVGFIETASGSFRRLFNITRSSDDALNILGVPEGFDPLDISIVMQADDPAYLDSGPICSQSVSKRLLQPSASLGSGIVSGTVNYAFSCFKDRGALLFLEDHADRLHCFSNSIMPRYIASHYKSWCRFAQSKYLNLDEPGLEGPILIRGWIKTSKWGVATWVSGGLSHDLTVSSGVGEYANIGVTISASDESSSGTHHRSGPKCSLNHLTTSSAFTTEPQSDTGSLSPAKRDQCVFLSYYKVKCRPLLGLKVIKAGAGPHDLPDGDDTDGDPLSGEIESCPDVAEYHDPLDDLLNYILENSDVDVAVACDDDINQIYGVGEWPRDLCVFLKERFPPIEAFHLDDGVYTGHLQISGAARDLPTPEAEAHIAEIEGQSTVRIDAPQSSPLYHPLGNLPHETLVALSDSSSRILPPAHIRGAPLRHEIDDRSLGRAHSPPPTGRSSPPPYPDQPEGLPPPYTADDGSGFPTSRLSRPPRPSGPRLPGRHDSSGPCDSNTNSRNQESPTPLIAEDFEPGLSLVPPDPAVALPHLPEFRTTPIKLRGQTLQAAQWTLSSPELQEIVSDAIVSSTEASNIRLLPAGILNKIVPEETSKIEALIENLKKSYREGVQRRNELLDLLSSSAGSEANSGLVMDILHDLRQESTRLDGLAESLHNASDQLGQLQQLRESHNRSGCAVALRRLNQDFIQQAGELQLLRMQAKGTGSGGAPSGPPFKSPFGAESNLMSRHIHETGHGRVSPFASVLGHETGGNHTEARFGGKSHGPMTGPHSGGRSIGRHSRSQKSLPAPPTSLHPPLGNYIPSDHPASPARQPTEVHPVGDVRAIPKSSDTSRGASEAHDV